MKNYAKHYSRQMYVLGIQTSMEIIYTKIRTLLFSGEEGGRKKKREWTNCNVICLFKSDV